ncbi:MAG: thioredoxin-like domain-containing protein [Desulfosalsimonadaceae bacterium]
MTSLQQSIKSRNISRWQAIRLGKASKNDLIQIFIIFIFGLLAVWTGQMTGFFMTPSEAVNTSLMLDELQLPRELSNLPVENETGQAVMLWDLLADERSILSVYAPWCPGCQKDIQMLTASTSKKWNLIVLISHDEDATEVRKKLDNLGLTEFMFYKDVTGKILPQGKVTKLPTNFLLNKYGKVLDRLVGYSEYDIKRLINKAETKKSNDESF